MFDPSNVKLILIYIKVKVFQLSGHTFAFKPLENSEAWNTEKDMNNTLIILSF